MDEKGQEEIRKRMNWIVTPFEARESSERLSHLAEDYLNKGFTQVVLLGMGGSSLAPEVISKLLRSKHRWARRVTFTCS